MKKVLFISSTGGHFNELMQLKPIFKEYNYHVITEKDKATENLKTEFGDRISYLLYGTRKNMIPYIFQFAYNFFKSIALFISIKPQYVVTTGTHTAVPMCYIAKLFGKKVIFIETFANINTKTLSGRMVYPIADLFIVQWKEMLNLYPRAVWRGGIY